MPYESNSDLPSNVRKMPSHRQTAFRKAFNSAIDTYEGDESKAFATAYAAAKKAKAKHDGIIVIDTKLGDEGGRRRRRWQERDREGREAGTEEEEFIDGLLCRDYRAPFIDAIYDREFDAEQRKEAASEGAAMKGGGYPIKNTGDLKNAIRAIGRAKDREATIRHIKKRARALGATNLLPEDWTGGSSKDSVFQDGSMVSIGRTVVVTDSAKCANCGTENEKGAAKCSKCGKALSATSDSATHLAFVDAIELDDAKVRFTEDGYMVATPRVARTGIQTYTGAECQKPDMDRVRVYRPADAVFAKDALKSFTSKPVTVDHPKERVTATTWKKYAVGQTGEDVLRDGESFRVPMVLMDAAAIQEFKNGKKQLSWGYDCDLDWTPGVTADGEQYDAVQRDIRANHLAVVAAARGGPQLSIGDSLGDAAMSNGTLKTVLIDSVECQMTDTAAVLVQRTIKGLEDQVENFKKKIKAKEEEDEDEEEERQKKDAAKDSAIKKLDEAVKKLDAIVKQKDEERAKLDAEMVVLKKHVADNEMTPQKLDAMVIDRLAVIRKAQTVMGDKLTVDGKTVGEIRRMVVDAKIGAVAKEWTDAQVEAGFAAIQAVRATAGGENRAPIDDAIAAFGRPGGGYTTLADEKQRAYDSYDKEMSEAWRGKAN